MTGYRLFELRGIPVYLAPGFAFLALYFMFIRGFNVYGLMFVAAAFVSLLVHEFGHALVAKRLKLGPKVILHGWGGLCAHDRSQRDRDDALIIAAGPGAGLAFWAMLSGLTLIVGRPEELAATQPTLAVFLDDLLWMNLYWSLLNLVPLFPLDGGQLFRLGMLKLFDSPAKAEKVTLVVGTGVASVGLWYGVQTGSLLMAILCGLLGWECLRPLLFGGATPGGAARTGQKITAGFLKEARAALRDGDPREAARLAFQARDSPNLHRGQVEEIWALLTVANRAMGEWQEALDWADKAPKRPEVLAAAAASHAALGDAGRAEAVLAEPEAAKIPSDVRADVEDMIADARAMFGEH